MFLDNIFISYRILLTRCKKTYLKKKKRKLKKRLRFWRKKKTMEKTLISFLVFNFSNCLLLSSKISLFFENSLVYNSYFISNEYSSSYFNSFSNFYPIFSFCVFVRSLQLRLHNPRRRSYYWDSFRFMLSSHTNIFFPWLEASLNSNFCSLQASVFNSRYKQRRWFRLVFTFIYKFFKASNIRPIVKYKKFNSLGVRFLLKGRVIKNRFCRIVRRVTTGDYFLSVRSAGTKASYNCLDYKIFTSYWGSSSITVFWNYKNTF